MQTIPIQPIPNQAFSIVLNNNQWDFIIKACNGIMAVSLTLNNVIIIENIRVVANQIIIPYQYLESGNFLFLTQNSELPNYTQFGITQTLIYLTAEELANLRTPIAPPIKADNFNPLGGLPLRFSPQGYYVAPVLNSTAWLNSSEDYYITKDDSNIISGWLDISGNANNATASSTGKPTYVYNAVNGKNAILLNGTTNFFNSNLSWQKLSTDAWTLMAVIQPAADVQQGIISRGRSGGGEFISMRTQTPMQLDSFQRVAAGGSGNITSGTAWALNTPHIVTVQNNFSAGNTTIWVDNINKGSVAIPGNLNANSDPFYYGASNNNSTAEQFFSGYIMEIIIYNFGLTSDQMAQNNTYFNNQWGL
jgi:hypothetical protein